MKNPSRQSRPAAEWLYAGIWQVLVRWFRVPAAAPTLPTDNPVHSFKPDRGFLRCLKLQFWLALIFINLLILISWIILAFAILPLALALALPSLLLAVIPSLLVYVGIHLRYDTTWYVISDRSLRIRRGIWVIHETTITFENIQNLKLYQGPVQRYFGIANLIVETAGGGGAAAQSGSTGNSSGAHAGIIEGIANAPELRERILTRLRATKAAGLGDEQPPPGNASITLAETRKNNPAWTPQHLTALREIRAAITQLRQPEPEH